MDANGLRSFGLGFNAGLQAWRVPAPADGNGGNDGEGAAPLRVTVESHPCHALDAARLASRAAPLALREKAANAAAIVLAPAMARDAAGHWLVFDAPGSRLLSVSALALDPKFAPLLAPREIALPAGALPLRDMAVTSGDVLLLAAGLGDAGGVWLLDLRARFAPTRLALPAGFVAQRLAAAPDGGAYALDVVGRRLLRLDGRPLAEPGVGFVRDDGGAFALCERNPDPPRAALLPMALPDDERPIGIAADDDGLLALLTARDVGPARIRLLAPGAAGFGAPVELAGPRFPHTLGWLDADRLALMTDGVALDAAGADAPGRDLGVFVYPLGAALKARLAVPAPTAAAPFAPALEPGGDYHPRRDAVAGPFVASRPRGPGGAAAPSGPQSGDRPGGAAAPSGPQSGERPGGAVAPSGPLASDRSSAGAAPAGASADGRAGGAATAAAAPSGPRLFYPRASAVAPAEPAPVARLGGAARAVYGVLANFEDTRLPGVYLRGAPGTVEAGPLASGSPLDGAGAWHRLFVEAVVPANTAVLVWLAANESGPPRFTAGLGAGAGPADGWFPHLVGDARALPAERRATLPADVPRAAWRRDPSEVPLGASALGCPRQPGTAGLFEVLIQRAGRTVRSLAGKRLWVVVELFGDSRATPELVALRAYAGRLSYRDRYLPALYREQVFGDAADAPGPATGADFLERFVDLFEGLFTGLEDRIANAHLLTDAHTTPPHALPWLAGWVGLATAPGLEPRRARWMLANAARLARLHGTLGGLQLALDIATDGGLTRGRLVVVENFRLRRTMATILGADLAGEDDPLLGMTTPRPAGTPVGPPGGRGPAWERPGARPAGMTTPRRTGTFVGPPGGRGPAWERPGARPAGDAAVRSGNSIVGDTLILGDEHQESFLALFRRLGVDPAASFTQQQRQRDQRAEALHALYDGLAFRATVLVHEALDEDELRLVRRVAETSAPAHVALDVVRARYPFMVAVAGLVGADSYLRAAEPTGAVTLEQSRLGPVDTLQGPGTLDARSGVFGPPPMAAPPVAPSARIEARIEGAPPVLTDAGGTAEAEVPLAQPFELDGGLSSAADGRSISLYSWTRRSP